MKKITLTKRKITIGILVIAMLLASGLFAIHHLQTKNLPVPTGVSFGVWYIARDASGYRLVEETLSYDETAKILTFVVKAPNNGALTFTQQPVPESVAGQTDMFEMQLKSLPEVAKFDSVNGAVSITHPTGSEQATAIMRSKGTLLLVHSEKQMSIDNWRALFNKMELII